MKVLKYLIQNSMVV